MIKYDVMKNAVGLLKSIHNWYYPVVLLIYLLALFLPDIVRPGVISAVFVILTAAAAVLRESQNRDKGRDFGLHKIAGGFSTEDQIAFLWIAFNLLS